jgi:hypothetical protein
VLKGSLTPGRRKAEVFAHFEHRPMPRCVVCVPCKRVGRRGVRAAAASAGGGQRAVPHRRATAIGGLDTGVGLGVLRPCFAISSCRGLSACSALLTCPGVLCSPASSRTLVCSAQLSSPYIINRFHQQVGDRRANSA